VSSGLRPRLPLPKCICVLTNYHASRFTPWSGVSPERLALIAAIRSFSMPFSRPLRVADTSSDLTVLAGGHSSTSAHSPDVDERIEPRRNARGGRGRRDGLAGKTYLVPIAQGAITYVFWRRNRSWRPAAAAASVQRRARATRAARARAVTSPDAPGSERVASRPAASLPDFDGPRMLSR
jgi:hypothetical protein